MKWTAELAARALASMVRPYLARRNSRGMSGKSVVGGAWETAWLSPFKGTGEDGERRWPVGSPPLPQGSDQGVERQTG
ncbi:MAG: hypothetical protein ACJ8DI_29815 [Ktedonobacteraceae bacterium]